MFVHFLWFCVFLHKNTLVQTLDEKVISEMLAKLIQVMDFKQAMLLATVHIIK